MQSELLVTTRTALHSELAPLSKPQLQAQNLQLHNIVDASKQFAWQTAISEKLTGKDLWHFVRSRLLKAVSEMFEKLRIDRHDPL